jgi:phage host-nuclease inhibitor protein Gam
MPTATRIKKSNTNIPQNLEQADRAVGQIGTHQAVIDQLEARAAEEIAAIRERLRKESEASRKARNTLMTSVFAFASANKALLTRDSKTIVLTNGSISWRWTPPAVSVEDDEAMIATLRRRGLGEFVRVKEELDRASLLASREELPRIAGLSFTQREEFVVKPSGSSEVAKTRTITLE